MQTNKINYTKENGYFSIEADEWHKLWESIPECNWKKAMEFVTNDINDEGVYTITEATFCNETNKAYFNYVVNDKTNKRKRENDDDYTDMPSLSCDFCGLISSPGGVNWEKNHKGENCTC